MSKVQAIITRIEARDLDQAAVDKTSAQIETDLQALYKEDKAFTPAVLKSILGAKKKAAKAKATYDALVGEGLVPGHSGDEQAAEHGHEGLADHTDDASKKGGK